MAMIDSMREAGGKAAAARREILRRAALAREPSPEGVCGPPLRLLLGEAASLGRRAAGPLPEHEAVRPQTVMLLPGFGAHPLRMRRMARGLSQAGHTPYHWGLGFNLGPTAENFAFLLDRIEALTERHGSPMALIGWSLGGIFARELAHRKPDRVARVVTMGTPFSGDLHANNAWRAYQFITGRTVDDAPFACDYVAKPPVPTVALWSPRDGVVSPRSARGLPHERDRAVALRCTHLEFASSAESIAEVLRQLDRDD